MRESHARSVSAVAELSGPSTTPTTTSSPSRLMVTALPLPLPCPSMTWSMRRSSASSPKTSVPLPGSMETRASGATSQSSDARSMRPRRPRTLLGRLCRLESIFIVSSSADSVGVDAAGVRVRRGGGAWVSADTPLRRRSAAPCASCVSSQPSSCRVSLPFDTRAKHARSDAAGSPGACRCVARSSATGDFRLAAPRRAHLPTPVAHARSSPSASHVTGSFGDSRR